MGHMTRDEVLAVLRRDNPHGRPDEISMYADYYLDYIEASENIKTHGNIVAHPRTGSPIDNPYVKIKTNAMTQLRKITRLKNVGAIWT